MAKKKKTKRRKRKGGGASKGSKFERDICKQLSLWWTNERRDDIFWRTSGSGARAKTRSKQGKDTFGQYGDVQAIDPIGQPLIDLCTIEIKVGYSRQTIFDLVDKLPNETKQPYKKFIEQARQDNANSNSRYWMLITKRRYKETLVIIPYSFFILLREDCYINRATPSFIIRPKKSKTGVPKIYGTTLKMFLFYVEPYVVKGLMRVI